MRITYTIKYLINLPPEGGFRLANLYFAHINAPVIQYLDESMKVLLKYLGDIIRDMSWIVPTSTDVLDLSCVVNIHCALKERKRQPIVARQRGKSVYYSLFDGYQAGRCDDPT